MAFTKRSRTPTEVYRTSRSPGLPADDEEPKKNSKPRIHLLDTCYICGNNFSKARVVIDHVRRIHGYELPVRRQGYKRPQNKHVEYVREKYAEYDYKDVACPSCWFHCPEENFKELNEHTREAHKPEKVDISKDEDDVYASPDKNGAKSPRRHDSIASAAIGRGNRERSATPAAASNDGRAKGRSRETSTFSDEVGREISGKLDELVNMFKSMFDNSGKQ